jgi:hypothetical protein
MPRHKIASWLLAALLVALPVAAPTARASAEAPAQRAAQAPDLEQKLGERLSAHIVRSDEFARSVFYTWTSPEQVEALRSSHALLVATAGSSGRASPFVRLLSELKKPPQAGHELAELLLSHPQLIRRRYAWTSPFATVLGLGERSYGEALIEVVLRPEAIIGRLSRPPPGGQPFAFADLQGRPVPASEVLAHPERLAAIYHLRPPGPQEPSDFVPFREYILCNEAMVLSWSVGTDAIRARLDSERELLRELGPHFAKLPPSETSRSAVAAWSQVPADAPLSQKWRAALAFDNRRYRPLAKNLEQIIAGLSRYNATPPALIQNTAQ